MLRPTYTRRPFQILLVGPTSVGKRTLATQLLKCRDVFYSINVAESLPKKTLDRIDYILVLVDMTNANSLVLANRILEQVSPKYLSAKLAVVATKTDAIHSWTFEKAEMESIVRSFYDIHIFYANLTNTIECKTVCDQISRLIKINTLQYSGLNSLWLKTLGTSEHPEQHQTTEITDTASSSHSVN
ncbi:hypothetical protein BY458DRAFT_527091 [Sporodiniella umbellata]|nr:hypothetical protein BY458DRAFT_527091 [Sporodiniella umbellata]